MKTYNRKISVSTFEESENQMLMHTANMSHEGRLEYLQKLREITHGADMTEEINKFHQSRIKIIPLNENS